MRYALRGLSRRPAFTFAVVVTLALGIGATTAIFSVVYSVLIKPLPYPNSDDLVRIRHTSARGDWTATSIQYLIYRRENATFADIGVWREESATLTDRGEPDRVRALFVSHGTLQAHLRRHRVRRLAADSRDRHPCGARAEPRQLKNVFLFHGLALSAIGAVVGLAAAVALGRLMSSLLFGIGPLDPAAYVVALAVTVAATALASYLPARRAATIDPIETLKAE
jgi:hypothetical protein